MVERQERQKQAGGEGRLGGSGAGARSEVGEWMDPDSRMDRPELRMSAGFYPPSPTHVI
jgi:hypothetical protein